MINYYELLEISKDASRDNIEAAIRKMRRTWNNRANNPNADIRAEAEQRIRAIAEAERILLDDSARREYDARLASAPVTGSTSGPSGREADDSEDWISLAIEYVESHVIIRIELSSELICQPCSEGVFLCSCDVRYLESVGHCGHPEKH